MSCEAILGLAQNILSDHLARSMNGIFKSSGWVRFAIGAFLIVLVLGFAVRKPLLITYHRSQMVGIWQTELGISPPKGLVVSVRRFFGLAPASPNPQAAPQAFAHREALLRLGYFSKRRFAMHPVSLGTPDFQHLCEIVAAQAGQQPTAQFDYDQPTSPSRVLGLFVYATPSEMPRWEQLATNLAEHHE